MLCPASWATGGAAPLVHGLLHLLGHEHGAEMEGRERAYCRRAPPVSRRPPSIIESFNYAFEGIIHVLRTQRNMRIHFAIAIGVLIAALASTSPGWSSSRSCSRSPSC